MQAVKAESATADTTELAEIQVTATKQSESITKVPLSIVAFSQEKMDRDGAKSVADIANLTPGVTISNAIAFGSGAGNTISIRGISSTAGSPTTAIYIDDTPIQVRLLNYASNAYPEIFDLERVEVLRGPQGTLFGDSSEGGNIRFITPAPSLTEYSVYGRSELSFTEGGAPSQEIGLAVGGPIVKDTLGFRLSVSTRQDGGWLDRQNYETKITSDNVNSQNTIVSRGALVWHINDEFLVTPSMFYQKQNSQDTSSYWPSISDPSDNHFVSGNVLGQPRNDLFQLPAIKVEGFLPGVTLTSISSFFNRRETTLEDFTNFESAFWGPTPYPYIPGQNAYMDTLTGQNNFTQEFRLQSPDANERLSWVVGAYYSKQRLHATEYVTDLFLPQLVMDATGQTLKEFFGQGLKDGRYTVTSEMRSTDSETALFGQATYNLNERWKAILGVRASKDTYAFHDVEGGPVNGPVDLISDGGKTEHPVTPKIGIADQQDSDNLYYATAAKGYRGGGAQLAVPTQSCGASLSELGITTLPKTYDSDSLWSYELGAKNKFADNRIQLSSSVFYVDWKNIQQLVPLSCGYNYYTNLGRATSVGFDTQLQAKLTEHFVTDLSIGYTNAEFKKTISVGTTPGSANLVSNGDKLDGYVPWTVALDGEYHYNWFSSYPGYTRANLEFHSRQNSITVRLDPTSGSYDPSFGTPQANTLVSLRSGVNISDWDLSLFIDNLFDAHPVLATTHDIRSSPLFYQQTFRPRTIGLTLVFRH